MRKLINLCIIFTASLLLLFQAELFAGVYKWTDENGQVHYGENPGGSDAEKVTIRHNETTKPRAVNTAEDKAENKNTGQTAEGAQDGSQNSTETPEEIQPEIFVEEKIPAKEKRALCQQAKSDIASISSRGRMREINAKGEYIYLTEEQRQQRLSAAKKRKKKYCK